MPSVLQERELPSVLQERELPSVLQERELHVPSVLQEREFPSVLLLFQVFVELEELHWDSSEELEWEETARWIKFEEDVEEGSGRWGRPHISALAFHSLADLRRGLEQGLPGQRIHTL